MGYSKKRKNGLTTLQPRKVRIQWLRHTREGVRGGPRRACKGRVRLELTTEARYTYIPNSATELPSRWHLTHRIDRDPSRRHRTHPATRCTRRVDRRPHNRTRRHRPTQNRRQLAQARRNLPKILGRT